MPLFDLNYGNPDANVLIQVNNKGAMSVITYETLVDAFGINCDWNTGEIYTSSIPGIARYTKWATDFLYLPTTLRP